MIKIENAETMGWEAAIRGMRNPMSSWEKSDSGLGCNNKLCSECGFKPDWCGCTPVYTIGLNDLNLMKRLRNAGTDHRKFMRMITVYVDITAPLYWWKEFDTYKVGTVVNSCSTMHKIHAKEFTFEDFSTDHLISNEVETLWRNEYGMFYKGTADSFFCLIVQTLNHYREKYLETKDKKYWWQMIQLLPSSYNQKRTVMLNYEVLANMYHSRKNHKLNEWRDFCEWIKALPYSEIIIGEE